MAEETEPMCGGISKELQGDDLHYALDILNTSLAKLSGMSDKPSFQVVKVKSVTSQVVAGMIYRYKVQLAQGDAIKESDVKIWSRPWLPENGTNIEIKLEGDDNVLETTF
ncbi:cystatin-like protein [Drosophila hydei]|uniref:Cystatin-like protein n=1 Tax=Drosophila hydei TaxID=7224 RepID=A0A6J1LQZ3_DROHY|nr:cystatin-like protein [Drosophila hydei]XP_023167406.1 cystatin-like protein [Drosophila hydei]